MASSSLDRRLGLTGNKAYKAPVDVATTGNITLSGEQSIDGVTTSESDVLAWQQTNPIDNGIWVSGTGTWQRRIDANTNQDLAKGTQVYVSGGTTYAGNRFVFTSNDPIQPGTSSITIALSTDSGTLQARLADPTSASNGASMVALHDAAGLYTSVNVEAAFAYLGVHNLQRRTVESFGASTSATAATNVTALQAAYDWLRDNGGHLTFKPGGVYSVNAALTCLIDSTPKKLLSRVVDFFGCTLDWSASGMTSGILKTVGATSISFLPEFNKQLWRGPVYIKGPQAESGSTTADFSWMNDADTTVVGLRTQYAQNFLFEAVTVSNCFIGRQRFWTWDDTWNNCTFRKHFYGEETQESCTTGTHTQCVFAYCALTNLFRVADTSEESVSAQKYMSCRAELSHAWAAFDPGNTSGGGVATDVQFNGIFFDNHYIEGMSDYDLIRVGTKVVDADIITNLTDGSPTFPAGADQDKYSMNICVKIAKFNHTLTSSSKLFSMPTSGNKCFGFDVVAPAHPINDVRNPNKMQSKRWLMLHSKTNITGQPHEEYSSCRGSMVIDGGGTPPSVLSQSGNLGALSDWPSALGGGGTLATGQYKVSMREDVYSSVFSHNLVGACSGGGAFGTVVCDHANSSRGAVRFTCVDTGGAAFNPSRICVQWEGITAEV